MKNSNIRIRPIWFSMSCFVLPWSSILAKSGLCARRHRRKHVARVISMSNAPCVTLSLALLRRQSARDICNPAAIVCAAPAQGFGNGRYAHIIYIRRHKEKKCCCWNIMSPRRAHFTTHRDFPTRISTFFRAITSMSAAVRARGFSHSVRKGLARRDMCGNFQATHVARVYFSIQQFYDGKEEAY